MTSRMSYVSGFSTSCVGHILPQGPGPNHQGGIGPEGGGGPKWEDVEPGMHGIWPPVLCFQFPQSAEFVCFSYSLERQPFTWQLAMATLMWSSYCAALALIPISRTRWVMVVDVHLPACCVDVPQADG